MRELCHRGATSSRPDAIAAKGKVTIAAEGTVTL